MVLKRLMALLAVLSLTFAVGCGGGGAPDDAPESLDEIPGAEEGAFIQSETDAARV